MMGYELIHPNSMHELMKYKKYDELCVTLLSWAIEKAKETLASKLDGMELAVVRIALHGGVYPAIGLRCIERDLDLESLAEAIEGDIDSIIRNTSVADFLEFVGTGNENWRAVTEQIMSR